MNTLVLTGKQQIRYEQRNMPMPQKGELIVTVAYCGICRTDRKAFLEGQRDLHLPRILGHEFSGRIVALGEGVKKYQVGDRVQIHPGIGCGHCEACQAGNDQRCREMEIFGFHLDGGFSQYCRIPAKGVDQGIVRPLAKNVSLKQAALCEPLGCAVHMLDTVKIQKGQSVLIAGAGVLGVMTASLARYFGAEKIIIYDPEPSKAQLAKNADFTVVDSENLIEKVKAIQPEGVDLVIPCCPYSSEIANGMQLLKNGGTLGFFSGLIEGEYLTKDIFNLIHYKEITVKGTYGVGAKDTLKAMTLLEKGFSFSDDLITEVNLEEAALVLKQRETPDHMVTMIKYEEENTWK